MEKPKNPINYDEIRHICVRCNLGIDKDRRGHCAVCVDLPEVKAELIRKMVFKRLYGKDT
jgi:hypothetical protein